jgi:hypothetical protein
MLRRTFSEALLRGQGKGRDGISALPTGEEPSCGDEAVVPTTGTIIDLHEHTPGLVTSIGVKRWDRTRLWSVMNLPIPGIQLSHGACEGREFIGLEMEGDRAVTEMKFAAGAHVECGATLPLF